MGDLVCITWEYCKSLLSLSYLPTRNILFMLGWKEIWIELYVWAPICREKRSWTRLWPCRVPWGGGVRIWWYTERLVVVVYLTPVTTLYSTTNKNPKQNKAAHQSNKNETHPWEKDKTHPFQFEFFCRSTKHDDNKMIQRGLYKLTLFLFQFQFHFLAQLLVSKW